MRTTFQEELDLLEATLQEEGALVLRALRGAINALEQRDHELADEVMAFDDDVAHAALTPPLGSPNAPGFSGPAPSPVFGS